MKFLHLVPDEKFVDFFASAMSKIEGCHHRYIVHTSAPDQPLRHILRPKPFRKVDNTYFSSNNMRADLASCDVLLVHFLTLHGAKMISEAPSNVKIVWSGWGADYYHLLPGGDNSLLGSKTRQIARRLNLQQAIKNPISLAKQLSRPIRRLQIRNLKLIPAIRRVDLFSSPVPDDYFLVKQHLDADFRATYVQLNYGSVEGTFAIGGEVARGANILVGNSASLTNNHVEVFMLLKKHDLSNRKVIVPLNYGDLAYRQIVLGHGQEILGSNFHPVINFLPIERYNELISSCSCAIMNHHRQQAIGNIGSILYRGAKLYLNRKNVVTDFFERRGAHIFDIQTLRTPSARSFDALTTDEMFRNREILEEFWGEARIFRNLLAFVETLRNLMSND